MPCARRGCRDRHGDADREGAGRAARGSAAQDDGRSRHAHQPSYRRYHRLWRAPPTEAGGRPAHPRGELSVACGLSSWLLCVWSDMKQPSGTEHMKNCRLGARRTRQTSCCTATQTSSYATGRSRLLVTTASTCCPCAPAQSRCAPQWVLAKHLAARHEQSDHGGAAAIPPAAVTACCALGHDIHHQQIEL
jgi:hypothetical protein